MRLSFAIRAALIALTAATGLATAAYADSGRIRFNVIKAGFVLAALAGRVRSRFTAGIIRSQSAV